MSVLDPDFEERLFGTAFPRLLEAKERMALLLGGFDEKNMAKVNGLMDLIRQTVRYDNEMKAKEARDVSQRVVIKTKRLLPPPLNKG